MKNRYRYFERLLKKPRDLLSEKGVSVSRYVVRAALISSIPVAAVTTIAVVFNYLHLDPDSLVYSWPLRNHPTLAFGIGLTDTLLLSPLVETGVALIPIWLLRKLRVADVFIPLVSGLLWGFLHCRGGSWFPIVQAWPFYCFTLILITHEKPSLDRAWLIASAAHSLNNVIALSLSAILAYLS